MSANSLNFFGAVMVIMLLTAATLVLQVLRELAPQGGLTSRGKWFLATGLGTGVFALAAKLLLIGAFISMPSRFFAPEIDANPPVNIRMADSQKWNSLDNNYPNRPHYVWQALPERAPAPADNPVTPSKAALGEKLFHDPMLSLDGTVSCSSCHDTQIDGAGIDGRKTSVGIYGQTGKRNAPTVWNAAFQSVLFWDGRAASLEEQAKGPLTNPMEMGMPSHAAVEARVRQNPEYRAAFAQAFGPESPITIDRIAAAIASYERTLITPYTPYDRFVRGDRTALSAAQIRGMALFEQLGCVMCHSGPNFSGASVLGTNTPFRIFPAVATPYESRYQLTEDKGRAPAGSERGVWRIPSLRNVALTGPYFHNGSVDKLEQAVRIMGSVQLGRPVAHDPQIVRSSSWSDRERMLTTVESVALVDSEVNDIVAFLNALSSDQLVARPKP